MIQTVSQPLCDPVPYYKPMLKINLTITIEKDGKYIMSKFSNENGDFVTINSLPRMVFRYVSENGSWDNSHQISIYQRNIFNLRLGFKKFYKIFQKDDIFRYDELGRIIELLASKEDTVLIQLGMGQMIRLEPSVVTDGKNKAYPGVLMTMNRESNRIPMTIDEYEMILDLVTTINIHQSGLTLMTAYAASLEESMETTMNNMQKRNTPKTNKPQSTKSLFDIEATDNEGVVSGIFRPKKPTTLDDL